MKNWRISQENGDWISSDKIPTENHLLNIRSIISTPSWRKVSQCFLLNFPVKLNFRDNSLWVFQNIWRKKYRNFCYFTKSSKNAGPVVKNLGYNPLCIPNFSARGRYHDGKRKGSWYRRVHLRAFAALKMAPTGPDSAWVGFCNETYVCLIDKSHVIFYVHVYLVLASAYWVTPADIWRGKWRLPFSSPLLEVRIWAGSTYWKFCPIKIGAQNFVFKINAFSSIMLMSSWVDLFN